MNPQGGEGNQSSPPTTAPIAESNVGVASNPLGRVVDAANEAAEAAKSPMEAFTDQFAAKAKPGFDSTQTTNTPPAEPAPDLMGQALANLETPPPAVDASTPQPSTDSLAREQIQPAEALAKPVPEQAPAERLKQEIAASVDAFLTEVLQKQGVTS